MARALVARLAVDHVFELAIFFAGCVAANELYFLQVLYRLEPVTLLHLPHAVIGPCTDMVGIRGQGLFVPDLRIVVIAKLAVGVAYVVGDVGMLVMPQRMHGRDATGVIAVENHGSSGAVVAQEFVLGQLLLLLFNKVVVLFLFLLVATVSWWWTVGAHRRKRFHADGGDYQSG